MRAKRVLPADVYDALELSALVYGGIGAGAWADYGNPFEINAAPVCAMGHAYELEGHYSEAVSRILRDAEISEGVNDAAVNEINRRRRKDSEARVSFADWCSALNVVRGES